jgi:hypothetical protein
LALANKYGEIPATAPGISQMSGINIKKVNEALEKFQSPDIDSRSREFEGRRIERIDGGYKLLNYEKFRKKMSQDERREYLRVKQAEHRAKDVNNLSTPVNKNKQCQHIAETEAETKAMGNTKTPSISEQIRKDRAWGKYCYNCGESSKTDSGRMTWREKKPFCRLYCYNDWVKKGRPEDE